MKRYEQVMSLFDVIPYQIFYRQIRIDIKLHLKTLKWKIISINLLVLFSDFPLFLLLPESRQGKKADNHSREINDIIAFLFL